MQINNFGPFRYILSPEYIYFSSSQESIKKLNPFMLLKIWYPWYIQI